MKHSNYLKLTSMRNNLRTVGITRNCMDNKVIQEIGIQDAISLDYEIIRYHNPYSEKYQDDWFRKMVFLIDKKGLILDNGCGVGHLAKFFPAENIIGCDISKGMLDKAKNKLQYLIRSDSQVLPLRNETFDVVFCRSVLHHLIDPSAGLCEMNRVLKPSGELIITEPIDSILSRIPRKYINKTEHFSELHKDFNSNQLIDLIVESKFSVKTVGYFGYIAYPMLGFPDIVDPFKHFPFKNSMSSLLISLDNIISKIPVINKISWAISIKAVKE